VARDYDRRYRGPIRRMNNRRVENAVLAALREAGTASFPTTVLDIPAGTGRFTAAIRAAGAQVCSLDRSAEMLQVLREKHGPGFELVADLHQPPLQQRPGSCVLSLRLMQHYQAEERVAALRAFHRIAPQAVVAYYPGWDWKNRFRRLRARLGLPVKKLREHIPAKRMQAEVEAAGWKLIGTRQVFPILSENVLLILTAK
jgi:SAM-dependent methyltransferase